MPTISEEPLLDMRCLLESGHLKDHLRYFLAAVSKLRKSLVGELCFFLCPELFAHNVTHNILYHLSGHLGMLIRGESGFKNAFFITSLQARNTRLFLFLFNCKITYNCI